VRQKMMAINFLELIPCAGRQLTIHKPEM